MRNLYYEIELKLNKLDFDNIWPGFSRTDFALYDKKKVILKEQEIPYDNRFLGNTSIDFNGSKLAIWHVEDVKNEDSIILASNIVHEMFHTYQLLNGEVRFPNDLKGLDYPSDLGNFEIKNKEHKLLASCFDEEQTKEEKLKKFEKIVALRKFRREKYGDEISYEFQIETIEGSAEYCGSKALQRLSNNLYEKRVNDYKNNLLYNSELLFDVRRMAYYSGTLFLILLDDLKINVVKKITGQNKTIFEEVSKKVNLEMKNNATNGEMEFESKYLNFVTKRKEKFKKYFAQDYKTVDTDATIVGYDPMNMTKENNLILCSNFIILADNHSLKKDFIQGPVVVKLKKDTTDHVEEYYQL